MSANNALFFGKKESAGAGDVPFNNMVLYQEFQLNVMDYTGNHIPTDNAVSYISAPFATSGERGISWGLNSSSYVRVPDSDLLSFTNGVNDLPFTIATSLKLVDDQYGIIIATKSEVPTGNEYILNYAAGTKTLHFSLFDSGNNRIRRVSSTALVESSSYTIIATYSGNGSSSGLNIYLNGINDNGGTGDVLPYNGMSNQNTVFGWGNRKGTSAALANNVIGMGQVFDVELSPEEVLELHNQIINNNIQYP